MAKVLLSAYACRPGAGSEPGVGWNYAQRLGEHHDVWVITRADNAEAINGWLQQNPSSRVRFVYHDVPRWVHRVFPGNAGNQVRYYFWETSLLDVARPLHDEVKFDVCQHVTYVRYWTPSALVDLPIPFIWGPVGGAESAPDAFKPALGMRGRVTEFVREAMRDIAEGGPNVRRTTAGSAIAFATTEETAARLRALGARRVEILSEAGLNADEIDALHAPQPPETEPFRFISMGRLLYWKGFHLGLEAFAQANLPDARYMIVGDGPEMGRLRSDAAKLGISDQVEFTGRLPRDLTMQRLANAHVLVHPSLHDSGGWVCLEAMASGRPVICLNLGGPATQVTEQTGFRISAQSPQQAVADLAAAMKRLHDDKTLHASMSAAGPSRVREFCWDRKIEKMNTVIAELLT